MEHLLKTAIRTTMWALGVLALWYAVGRPSGRPSAVFPRTAEAQSAVDAACGDANGDERIDIADAIYIINWALRAGPDLVCPDAEACSRRVEELELERAEDQAVIAEQKEVIAQQTARVLQLEAVTQECEARGEALAAQLAAARAETQKLEAQLVQAQAELEQCQRELIECEQP